MIFLNKTILIISSDKLDSEGMSRRLASEITSVYLAANVKEAIKYLSVKNLCLIILDAEISQQDDHMLLKAIDKLKIAPVLILSSRPGHVDRLETLQAGAHAYMGLPFTIEECLAQAQALMKIHADRDKKFDCLFTIIAGNGLTIDPYTRQVFMNEKEVKLTKKEFDLLYCLASSPGQVFTREQLYNYVWNEQAVYNIDDVVKAHIKALRRKLSDADVTYIRNVWGIGDYFHDDENVP
mgnify:CR=1 FL=1